MDNRIISFMQKFRYSQKKKDRSRIDKLDSIRYELVAQQKKKEVKTKRNKRRNLNTLHK